MSRITKFFRECLDYLFELDPEAKKSVPWDLPLRKDGIGKKERMLRKTFRMLVEICPTPMVAEKWDEKSWRWFVLLNIMKSPLFPASLFLVSTFFIHWFVYLNIRVHLILFIASFIVVELLSLFYFVANCRYELYVIKESRIGWHYTNTWIKKRSTVLISIIIRIFVFIALSFFLFMLWYSHIKTIYSGGNQL
jgi:hypothetical protein